MLLPRQSRFANSERCWNWFERRTAAAGLSSGAVLAATLALRRPDLFAAAAFHSGVPAGAAYDAHDAGRVMAEGPLDARTDALALEARAAAGAKARMPALVIQGMADTSVAPVNASFVVRQFLLFNGLAPEALPPGLALPPTHTRAVHPLTAGYLSNEYYAGRRLAARLVTVPRLGHAWSGGDSAYPYCDDAHVDATSLVCDFFDAHRRKA